MHTGEQYSITKRMKCRLMFQRMNLDHILKQNKPDTRSHTVQLFCLEQTSMIWKSRNKKQFCGPGLGKETVGTGYY